MTDLGEVLQSASARTQRLLFAPFDAAKYVSLAFCVWLYQLGGGGAQVNFSGNDLTISESDWERSAEVWNAWGAVLVLAAVASAVVGLLISVALLYVKSRAAFMVVDGMVKNRADVGGSWSEWAREGGDLFRFRLLVAGGALGIGLLFFAVAGVGVYATWTGSPFAPVPFAMLAVAGLCAGLVGAVGVVADACATEFVVPLVYARRYAVRDGFRDLGTYARADAGGFATYVALRFAVALGTAAVAVALICLTCGVAGLPFVGTLVLLPLFVFERSLSLAFVGQRSEDLAIRLETA